MLVTTGRWAQYDANLGVTEPSGDFIWLDQSGNGHTLFSALVTPPELIPAEINGEPAVSSYGLDNCKLSTSGNFPNILSGGSVFLVAKQSKTIGTPTDSDTDGAFVYSSDTNVTVGITRRGTNNGANGQLMSSLPVSFGDTSIAEDTFVTIALVFTGSFVRTRVNGVEIGFDSVASQTYAGAVFDMFSSANSVQGNKMIAFCVVYENPLTSDEILQNELYLKTRYNHY